MVRRGQRFESVGGLAICNGLLRHHVVAKSHADDERGACAYRRGDASLQNRRWILERQAERFDSNGVNLYRDAPERAPDYPSAMAVTA